MKIAVDARCLQDRIWTGVAEYTWNILHSLKQQSDDINLELLTLGWKAKLPTKVKNLGTVINTKISNRLINSWWSLNLGPSWDNLAGLDQTKPDFIWVPNLSFYKFKFPTPKILTVHDLSFIHFPNFFSTKKRLWYLRYIKTIIKNRLQEFSLILTVSEATADDLISWRPDLAPRIKVIKPGLAPEFATVATKEAIVSVKQNYQLTNDYILSVGTIEPRKNHLLLLKIFEQLAPDYPNLELVIGGSWGWKYTEFVDCLKKMKYGSRVKLLGYIPRLQQVALYAGAKIFLYPSFYEGFGFPPLEAMSQGVPTIVSNVSSLPEITLTGALYCNPWIPDEWLQTIKFLLNNQDYAAQLSKRGQVVASSYTWDKTAKDVIMTLNKL